MTADTTYLGSDGPSTVLELTVGPLVSIVCLLEETFLDVCAVVDLDGLEGPGMDACVPIGDAIFCVGVVVPDEDAVVGNGAAVITEPAKDQTQP